jgi:predicted RNase H-like HicB family nuclease/uncharacterized protein (DUF1778 family)
MESYIALLRKEPGSDYGVSFPDFPGCITAGSTLEEARLMAKEALEAHIAFMAEDGDPIPEPGTLDAVLTSEDVREAIPFLVDVAMPDEPAERVNVTFRRSILGTIDRAAASRGESRSEFLARAGMERAHRSDRPVKRTRIHDTRSDSARRELHPAHATKKKLKGKAV